MLPNTAEKIGWSALSPLRRPSEPWDTVQDIELEDVENTRMRLGTGAKRCFSKRF